MQSARSLPQGERRHHGLVKPHRCEVPSWELKTQTECPTTVQCQMRQRIFRVTLGSNGDLVPKPAFDHSIVSCSLDLRKPSPGGQVHTPLCVRGIPQRSRDRKMPL